MTDWKEEYEGLMSSLEQIEAWLEMEVTKGYVEHKGSLRKIQNVLRCHRRKNATS